jgi:ubiquinone/menaquinone biosynthesis C-methylase UbiE
MEKPMSDLGFRLMSLGYKFRHFFRPRMDVLEEVGIHPGFCVLDYGCGPGGYIAPLAELVGSSGEIYALDIHPLAVKRVRSIATKKGLTNVKTIQSDCNTELAEDSVDVVLLYDILHHLSQPEDVLRELHRILKPKGILSVSDHHMKEPGIVSQVTAGNLFRLSTKGPKTYAFSNEG